MKYQKMIAALMVMALLLCSCSGIKQIKPAEALGSFQTEKSLDQLAHSNGYWYSVWTDYEDGDNLVYSISVSSTPGEENIIHTVNDGFISELTAGENYAVWLERRDATDSYILYDRVANSYTPFKILDSTERKQQLVDFQIYGNKVYYLLTEGTQTAVVAYSIENGATDTVHAFQENISFISHQMEENRFLAAVFIDNEKPYIFHLNFDAPNEAKYIAYPSIPERAFQGRKISYDPQNNAYAFCYYSDTTAQQKIILIHPDSNEVKEIASVSSGSFIDLLCRDGHIYWTWTSLSAIFDKRILTSYDFINKKVQEVKKINRIIYANDTLYGVSKDTIYRVF